MSRTPTDPSPSPSRLPERGISEGREIAVERCGECRFAVLPHAGTIVCKRYPPQPFLEPGKVWNIRARLGEYDWCGEFAPQPLSQDTPHG